MDNTVYYDRDKLKILFDNILIIRLLKSWERLKNHDFEEINFVESPPHSLLDI